MSLAHHPHPSGTLTGRFPTAPWHELTVVGADPATSDGLAPMRGLVVGAVLSLPVWAAVGAAAWKALH
jgi:hypothetical protein